MSETVGIGYTLATGNLYTSFGSFHAWAEKLIGRPIFTHEFADSALWDEMRQTYEQHVLNNGDVPLQTHRPTRSEQSLEGAAVNGLTPVGQEAASE